MSLLHNACYVAAPGGEVNVGGLICYAGAIRARCEPDWLIVAEQEPGSQ
jgi:hypothetical protein